MRRAFVALTTLAVVIATANPAGAQPASGAPAFKWTGLYFGVAGGGGFGTTKHTNASNGATSGNDSGLQGGIVGGTYGFNWQIDPSWVVGLEGDISWSPILDKFRSGNGFCGIAPGGCVTDLHWLGTDRLRAGFLTGDDWLFYATGGVAYGDIKAGIPRGGCCTEETHTRVGYTVGGGVETSIAPAMSLKLEYLFVDFGRKKNYLNIVPVVPVPELVSARVNVLRVGINYEIEP